MTPRISLALCLLLAACSLSGDGQPEDVVKSAGEIRIKVGYDAAHTGVDARAVAAEHCAAGGKQAVWYGHDRDGYMHFKCE